MSLVLSRREKESVVLFTNGDEQIVITIEEVTGRQVRLSFGAPESVEIWRDELLDRKDEIDTAVRTAISDVTSD